MTDQDHDDTTPKKSVEAPFVSPPAAAALSSKKPFTPSPQFFESDPFGSAQTEFVPFAKGFRDELAWMMRVVNDCSTKHGWWDDEDVDGHAHQPIHDASKIALMHSELSEALEGIRRPGPDQHLPQFTQVEVELADTMIRIMDFAQQRNLRLGEALVAKAKYNQSRPYKHGGASI